MPIILLVDDSEVDRKLMSGLLSTDVDWLVSHAKNGIEALDMLTYTLPDVVVTDLMMPEMDGMELVARMSTSFPEVPVVLVTGLDDSELALKALRTGAASFVPKQQISERLLDTVEQVLSVRDADHYDDRLVEVTTNTRYRFSLENDPALIAPVVDRVQDAMKGMQLCSPTQRMHIGIALEEAMINAMIHGNLEISPQELPEIRNHLHEGRPHELVESRRAQSPYCDRKIHVAADFNRQRAQLIVGDDGKGFNVKDVFDLDKPDQFDPDASRGLLLINIFMDEVLFNDTGNEMRMTLKDLRPIPELAVEAEA